MTAATRTGVGVRPTSGARRWASPIETLLALVAIAALLPQFDRLSSEDSGRDRRFADVALSVGGLPDRILPALCATYGALEAAPFQSSRDQEPLNGRLQPAAEKLFCCGLSPSGAKA